MPPSDVAGSLDIHASLERVYALITDLATMAELAEETESMRWTTGSAAVPGAVFKGGNRKGRRRWTTTTDRRPRAFATVSGIALGVKDRGTRNATHIHSTLARLKRRAEAG